MIPQSTRQTSARPKGLLAASILAMLALRGATPADAAALTYNFDDGTLQGWTTVASDPGNNPDPETYASVGSQAGISPQGGTKFVMCQPSNTRDNAHKPLWIRSPQFIINQAGNLTLYLAGGTSKGGYPGTSGTLPTNASQIPLGVDSTANGLMGVALRDTATGEFVRTAERPGPSDAAWKQIVWDVSTYRDNGRTYTVELFDYNSGGGGWDFLSMDTVSVPGALAAVPTITATGTLAAMSTTCGTASSATGFSVAGSNMTAGITVTPPVGLEVSTTSATSGFAGSGTAITVGASGTIAATTVYVRLAATAAAGSYNSLNIVLSSSGATSVNITTTASGNTVSGAGPTITATGTLAAMSTTYGTASSATLFSLAGSNMIAGITVTPPSGLEVSQTSASSGFAGSGTAITVGASDTIAATTVYVRLAATAAAGSYNSLNIVLSSSGATSVNITTTATGNTVSGMATSSITYNFDDGTLQGWTTVSSDSGNSPDPENYAAVTAQAGINPQGGAKFVMCQPSANRDDAHRPLWIRSPRFVISQAGNLMLYLAGGTSKGGYPGTSGTLPTNASQIPLGVDSTVNGLMGVALRDTATGDFVLTAERPGPSDASWKQISWDVSAYLNDGKTYTVDLFDYHSGNGWSHLAMDTVSIPGTLEALVSTTITGKVTDAASAGVPNVVVTTTPGGLMGTTDANGDYNISNAIVDETYTLNASNLPARKMLDITPATFIALASSNTGKDFTLKDTTTISGTVTAAAVGVRYAVVRATPGGLTSTTDATGNYAISGASSGVTYTLSVANLPLGKVVAAAPAAFVASQAPNTGKNFTLGVATLTATPNDTDADGLPDAYETATVGNTTSLSAGGDLDRDGTSDTAEYCLGLIPDDPTSTFKLTIFSDPATGDVVLTWPSKQGAQFDVQWSESMDPGTWSSIGTVSAAAGSSSTFTDFGDDILGYPRGLYRVCLTSTDVGYVYSSFTGDGEDGLHLLTSADGKVWKTVRNYASIYQQSEGLMRDPSICRGGDGMYHLVWTTGWWNDTIGIAHSYNLTDWTPMQSLHVWADYTGPGSEESPGTNWPADLSQDAPRNPKVRNCWAPEIFYDDQTAEYVIFWATTIDDASVFPLTWDAGRWERMNQRVYYVTTKDFTTYTPRKFFYAKPDRVVIDACICKVARGQYRMVIKDELTQRLHIAAPTQRLTTWAEMPGDFWGVMSSPAFTGPGVLPDNTNAEGPSVMRVGGNWFVYCDYWLAGKNGLFSTNDFSTMTRLNDQYVAPLWVRHGSAFRVPKADYMKLEALK